MENLTSYVFPNQTAIQTLQATVQYYCYKNAIHLELTPWKHIQNILLGRFKERHPISTYHLLIAKKFLNLETLPRFAKICTR